MDKKSVDMEKNDNRSELLGKVEIKEGSNKKVNKKIVDVNLEQTIALDDVLKVTNPRKHNVEEKRSEITGKFSGNKKNANNKEIVEKIKEDIVEEVKEKEVAEEVKDEENSMKENFEDKIQENVENVSIAMIALILIGCFVVGGVLGYLLYKVAINNSNVLSIIFSGLF